MRKRFRWGAVTGLLAFGAAVALFRRWLQRQSREALPGRVEYVIPCEAEEDGAAESVVVSMSTRVQDQETLVSRGPADDLTKIEGVGPKSAQVLAAAGILSFERLSERSVEQLRQILKEAGLRIVYPDTWPEQAGLAAVGDWTGLEALQAQLDRGRRPKG